MLIRRVVTLIRDEFFFRDEFDLIRGTETSLHVHRWRLGLGKDSVRYEPTSPETFARVCRSLPPEAKTYPIFDLGSGKGRVLIMAHEAGFHQIFGVELSQKLNKICRRNLSKLKIDNVSILTEDAARVSFPDSPITVFMYNPFQSPIFDAVIERLTKHRHPVFIAYSVPKHRSVIERTNCFVPIYDENALVIYRSITFDEPKSPHNEQP